MDKVLSVIIPVYNTEKYLDKCLSSVIGQSYRNLEIIIIDDGSTDGSGRKCDQYANMDKRISVYHRSNGGVSRARNFGLDVASGTYITFLDGDDWIEQDMYAVMVQHMEQNNYMVCAGGYCREKNGRKIQALQNAKEQFLCRNEAIKEIFDFKPICDKILSWEVCDKIFCRKILSHVRFASDIAIMEDMLFLWQVMKNVDGVYLLPLYKYHYLVRENSATMKHRIDEKNLAKYKAIETVWKSAKYEDSSVMEAVHRRFLASLIVNIYEMLRISPVKYQKCIKERQSILRKNFAIAINIPNLGLLGVAAVVAECMPYGILRLIFLARRLVKG